MNEAAKRRAIIWFLADLALRGPVRRLACCDRRCYLGRCECGGNLLFDPVDMRYRCIGTEEPICISLN